ncbi:hypothetical protein [Mycobacterium servetii]|uniref:Transmembrane protein n=1 Tax=Mycobacterium servetii TaxID=3237418 RepID=A0ABV4C6Q8_9MYCO
MTEPHSDTESPGTRPISVAELLAKNGTIGAPAVTRRRRRRRGDSDAVTVAELTGDIPVIRDDHDPGRETNGTRTAEAPEHERDVAADDGQKSAYWSEPEPRWPKSPPQPARVSGPERSAYPRPVRQADERDAERQSGAEGMSPDPVDDYAGMPVDVMDSEVRDADLVDEDSAYVRSYLDDSTLFGGQTLADELARRRGGAEAVQRGEDRDSDVGDRAVAPRRDEAGKVGGVGRFEALRHGSVVVVQSILAVAFGAGLFIAFDQLWRWNSIVALVLSVLVILGLVVGVRVVRKTEDIASTLIAVAVGALITLGPLALSLQSG